MNRPQKDDSTSPGYHSSLFIPLKLPESIFAAVRPVRILGGLYVLFTLMSPATARAQERIPIHVRELLDHRGTVVDFARADSIAASMPPVLPRALPPTREIVGYLPFWTYPSYPDLDYGLLTQINYFSAELDSTGRIIDDHHWSATPLVDFAHARGVKVKLCATLSDWGGTFRIDSLLSNPVSRQRAIDTLLAQVQALGADGVDIDFEPLHISQRDNMVTFMQALTTAFHDRIPGSLVTIAVPADDWGGAWDYNALAQIVDGIFIMAYDYHWRSGPIAGPVSPLDGFWTNVRISVDDFLTATDHNPAKLILGLPYYGWDWPVENLTLYPNTTGLADARYYDTAYDMALTYGRNWDDSTSTPWVSYQSSGWRQLWYDDSLSLSLKYKLAIDKDLAGVGMWALGFDGDRPELWGALADHFTTGAAPSKPKIVAAINNGDGTVTIAANSFGADSLRLYTSANGVNFGVYGTYTAPAFVVAGLPADAVVYFKTQATNSFGESPLSEVFGTVPASNLSPVLIVNGFDRSADPANTFDFITRHGPHVARLDLAFDGASNEAVSTGLVNLDDYLSIIWILGEESTADESFSLTEQQILAEYLEAGGQLMVSGSEIGYDLVEAGSETDQSFYRSYLKAEYITDRTRDNLNKINHQIDAEPGAILAGLAPFSYDDGDHGAYYVDWPDGIKPIDGSALIARYHNVDYSAMGGAGITYQGTFGFGTAPGRLVYLAVGFETIYPSAARDSVMARIFDYFQTAPDTSEPAGVIANYLYQNYPNPFMERTTIPYDVVAGGSVRLAVYNLRGALVWQLVLKDLPANHYEYTFMPAGSRGRRLASGIYLITLRVDDGVLQVRKMTLRK
ncbi:MAG: glycosyl hydrolase family 18 protein [Candidatus Neomarinimicrobiota bacterium]